MPTTISTIKTIKLVSLVLALYLVTPWLCATVIANSQKQVTDDTPTDHAQTYIREEQSLGMAK